MLPKCTDRSSRKVSQCLAFKNKVDKANAILDAKRAAAGPEALPKGAPSVTAERFGTIYFSGALAEPGRAKRWLEMAHRLLGDEEDPHMAFQLQECGFLDTLLVAFESEKRTDPGNDPGDLYIAGQIFRVRDWRLLASIYA